MRQFIEQQREHTLNAYRAQPRLLREHVGIERTVLAGGYGYRQILELIQNSADAILEGFENRQSEKCINRIHVLLSRNVLYVANTGAPLSNEGLESLLSSHSSPKRGNQIGRFGLGFKSLLSLGNRVDIFTKSRDCGVRFDPTRCREELKSEFNVIEAPGLRLAWAIDNTTRNSDVVLSQFDWAETIVRVPISAKEAEVNLRREINEFPPEFLLFFAVPTVLTLDDGKEPLRELKVEETENSERILHCGDATSRWLVKEKEVTIADVSAKADATHIHDRETVPISWAIPLEGKREESGRFWAFFPTQTPTYIPGIVNAPWKVNSDRQSVITGEWNNALMREVAAMIAETLPTLSTPEDPARPLDYFPRQLDRRDDIAVALVEPLWQAIQTAEIIPDAHGKLRRLKELAKHPITSQEIAEHWTKLAVYHHRASLIHASCYKGHRFNRISGLLKTIDAVEWFQGTAMKIDNPLSNLELSEAYSKKCNSEEWNGLYPKLRIVLGADKAFHIPGDCIIAPATIEIPPGKICVHETLSQIKDALRILTQVLHVQTMENGTWERTLTEHVKQQQWEQFWIVLRQTPTQICNAFVKNNRDKIRIKTSSVYHEIWKRRYYVLLPGKLELPARYLVDMTFHTNDVAVLKLLGISDYPDLTVKMKLGEVRLKDYIDECRTVCAKTEDARRNYHPDSSTKFPNGLQFLDDSGCVQLTEALLDELPKYPEEAEFMKSSRSGNSVTVDHPLIWILSQNGQIQIGKESIKISSILDRFENPKLLDNPALRYIPEWSRLKPKLIKLTEERKPQISNYDDFKDALRTIINEVQSPESLQDDSLYDLWNEAAEQEVLPETLRTNHGDILLNEVYVTTSAVDAEFARQHRKCVVRLNEHALNLWKDNGAQDLSKLMTVNWENAGEAVLLVNAYPELSEVLEDQKSICQPVSKLFRTFQKNMTSESGIPIPCVVRDAKLLFDSDLLETFSQDQRIRTILEALHYEGWLKCEMDDAIRLIGDADVTKRRAAVKNAAKKSLAEGLLKAVGKNMAPLHHLFAPNNITDIEPIQLAELALMQFGPVTLQKLKDTLSAERLNPPERWGSDKGRAFVASIGFPPEFAVAAEAKLDAEEYMSGPIPLPELHDFQLEVFDGLKKLIESSTKRRRAVVSLPTGGGKTRVTVEAAVKLVLAPEGTQRSVIWIAQTDELCEQAVQAFRQVWVNYGARNTELRIVRFWGGHRNPVSQATDKPVVIVVSIQTLNARSNSQDLAWLQKPGLVIVDECHHAIAPSYSNLLRWLDILNPASKGDAKDEPPVIGLSATPFRSMGDGETARLAARFDKRWFPINQKDLYQKLQDDGVLAQPKSEALESGAKLEKKELDDLERYEEGLELDNAIERINDRLSNDDNRNDQIVECIRKSKEKSILLFANSVMHSKNIAIDLYIAGIPAVAISADTAKSARRWHIDKFQRGEIRVLCNHSVLTTGFDAPKVEMILISPIVFSPVRYMQMVGRGLRGPKNGGTERCRIVTVMDNLGSFGNRHAYHYCARHFQ